MAPTSRQQQKADTAKRIYAAALRLFTEQGYAATTVEQITQAAGVAKGTFFTHFASKDAVLDHIGELQMARVNAALAADPQFAQRPIAEQLRTIFRALAGGVETLPAEMRALTIEIAARRSIFDVDRQGIGALDQLFAALIAAAQARGELRAGPPPERLANLIRGAYFLAFFEWVNAGAGLLTPLADEYLDLVLEGVLPDGAAR